jgi:hypothetical protein
MLAGRRDQLGKAGQGSDGAAVGIARRDRALGTAPEPRDTHGPRHRPRPGVREANEISAALELLKTLPLKGATITGDAIFTKRAICQLISDGGGDYFFTVKGNQPAQKADLEQAFRPFSPLVGMVCAG